MKNEIALGGGKLNILDAKISKNLDFTAKSFRFQNPQLISTGSNLNVTVDLWETVINFSPTLALSIDSLNLHFLSPQTQESSKKEIDSLPFPNFKLPVKFSIHLGQIKIEDSSQVFVEIQNLKIHSTDPKQVFLEIGQARKIKGFSGPAFSIKLNGDWRNPDSVFARIQLRPEIQNSDSISTTSSTSSSSTLSSAFNAVSSLFRENKGDSIILNAHLSSKNLMQGWVGLQTSMASSKPYTDALLNQYHLDPLGKNSPSAIPDLTDFLLNIKIKFDSSFHFSAETQANISEIAASNSWRLSPQKLNANFTFEDTLGIWSLKSHAQTHIKNAGEEHLDLQGSISVASNGNGKEEKNNPRKLNSPMSELKTLIQKFQANMQGELHGAQLSVGGKKILADLNIPVLQISKAKIVANLQTGEGSNISLNLVRDSSSVVIPWAGKFSIDLKAKERWLTAFTDTNITFDNLVLDGKIKSGKIISTAQAKNWKGYGSEGKAIVLNIVYDIKSLKILPSTWEYQNDKWMIMGEMGFPFFNHPAYLSFESPASGLIKASMPIGKKWVLHTNNFFLENFPYPKVKAAVPYHPKISTDFNWDQKSGKGGIVFSGQGNFKEEIVSAKTEANWTLQEFEVKSFQINFANSTLEAGAKIGMQGRPFYSVYKAKIPDIKNIHISSDAFDLGAALAKVLPKSPLKSGQLNGNFAYNDREGYSGRYNFRNLALQGKTVPAELKELALIGKGDTLGIVAITHSEKEPMLNDTVQLDLNGALEKIQNINLHIHSTQGLMAYFHGQMHEYKDLKGEFSIHGKIDLPNQSGELQQLQVTGSLVSPFQEGLKGLLVDIDSLKTYYAIKGFDTQEVYAQVHLQNGKVQLPVLKINSKSGSLTGQGNFDLISHKMSSQINGASFAFQIGKGDKFLLKDFRISVESDSTTLKLQSEIGKGSIEHLDPPLRAAADLTKISIHYTSPLASKDGMDSLKTAQPKTPFLSIAATLDNSTVRYRLKSIESLQNLFKRKAPSQGGTASANSKAHTRSRSSKSLQLQIDIETSGSGNTIETDILRLAYVGNISMSGIYPYVLMQGRINSNDGWFGAKKQAYHLRNFETKWLNTPIEEGQLELESEKKLARSCSPGITDSCSVLMRVGGSLNDLQFSYDSDCQGSFGSGIEVTGLIYSMQRGCYSADFSSGGPGLSYQKQALSLIEAPLNGYLSEAAEKISGSWISSAQITGLSALVQDSTKGSSSGSASGSGSSGSASGAGMGAGGATGQEAIALELLSKEFWRVRLRAKSSYQPDHAGSADPWGYLAGLEWRPPLYEWISHPKWKSIIKNNVNLDATIFTDPDQAQNSTEKNLIKRLGFNYSYNFWGKDKTKKPPIESKPK